MLTRQIRYLIGEFKQSYWLAALTPALVAVTCGVFLALHFSPYLNTRVRSMDMLAQMSIVLAPLGASLWGHLVTSSVFEKARGIFLVRQPHFLSRATVRVSGAFLLLLVLGAAVICLSGRDVAAEAALLLLRTACVSLLYFALISLIDFVFRAPFLGLALSLFLILGAYSSYFGWIQPPRWWATLTATLGSFHYSLVILGMALLLMLSLYACESLATNRS